MLFLKIHITNISLLAGSMHFFLLSTNLEKQINIINGLLHSYVVLEGNFVSHPT